MAQEKKLIPKRRFKEFQNDGDWEPRKVEGYATFLKGNGLSWNDITKYGQQECILYGNLYTDYGMIAEDVVYKTNTQLKNGIYSKFGDVLIPASDTTPTGLARATSIEKTGVLLGGDINVIRPCDEIDGSCLSLAINTNRKELIKLIKGTTVKHIYNSDIKNIYITLPKSIEEQRKLVLLFKDIDNLITLQQHKLEKIKSMKKAYLYEMFPAEGESKPKRRFKGFTDDWEQCKLDDFGKSTGGTSIESEFCKEGKYKVISIGSYSEDSKYNDQGIRVALTSKTESRVLNHGDLTMILNDKTASGRIIGRVLLIENSDIYVYNQRTERIEVNNDHYDSNYLFQMLNAPSIRNKIVKQCQGNTQIYVNWSMIKETKYMVPKLEEQKRIGAYFDEVDNLITLHQSKLDKLKNLKKAYLNEMFI